MGKIQTMKNLLFLLPILFLTACNIDNPQSKSEPTTNDIITGLSYEKLKELVPQIEIMQTIIDDASCINDENHCTEIATQNFLDPSLMERYSQKNEWLKGKIALEETLIDGSLFVYDRKTKKEPLDSKNIVITEERVIIPSFLKTELTTIKEASTNAGIYTRTFYFSFPYDITNTGTLARPKVADIFFLNSCLYWQEYVTYPIDPLKKIASRCAENPYTKFSEENIQQGLIIKIK